MQMQIKPLEDINDVTEYLKIYGRDLAEKIQKKAEPLFNPGEQWDKKINELLRKPYQAQGDAIMGIIRALKKLNSVIIVGEMGCGKTIIAASVPYVFSNKPSRTLVMCPGHLVRKWQREILETVPKARVMVIRELKDVLSLKDKRNQKAEAPEYFVISKDRAKLGYAWKPAVVFNRTKKEYACPNCGNPILDKDGVPISIEELSKRKRFCENCNSALWQADAHKIRRFAISEYIKKYLKGYFDFFIADEVHELKGGSTAQGNSFGSIASASKNTIALTGTWSGGYADDSFFILYRLSPETMKNEGIEYGEVSKWMARYGVLERVRKIQSDDNVLSKGRKPYVYLKKRPGISPMVFSNHLMDKCVFIHLDDIALDLPPIKEEVVQIEMDEELSEAYRNLENELKDAVKSALSIGSKSLLSTYLNSLLSYPDKPFNNEKIADHEGKIVAIPEELSQNKLYPKEEQLIKLIEAERKNKRRVFVYCQYTNTKDITSRLKDILKEKGFKAEVLRGTVNPEQREAWLEQRVKEGYEIIIANPKLVETGLDLYDFPTLVFYQTGYSIFTLRQASRRSWRIGQKRNVKVYYFFYKTTMQERALQLIGSKLEASLAIEGKFSEEGLLSMTQGEDMTTIMAKALVNGLEVDGIEKIWRKLNEANKKTEMPDIPEDEVKTTQENEFQKEPEKEPVEQGNKSVFIDFVSFRGKKKSISKVKANTDELNEILTNNKDLVQFSLFE